MASKKKLVVTPLTRTIWWATVNDSKGMIIGDNKIDVTDDAIESVLDHFILDDNFANKGFSGYTYKKKDGNEVTICGFDERHLAIDSKLWEEVKAKAAELDRLKLAIKDAMILYPYKVHGEGCTYESYNQGWQDALGYVESEVE